MRSGEGGAVEQGGADVSQKDGCKQGTCEESQSGEKGWAEPMDTE